MNIQISKKKFIYAFLSLLPLLFLFSFFTHLINNRVAYENSLDLTSGWTLTINSDTYESVDLSTFTFPATQPGDVVTLEGTLPDTVLKSPTIRFWMCHSAIEVYFDDLKIYEFGMERYQEHLTIGTGYHWVPLPNHCSNKTIRFVFYANERNSFTNINVPILGESGDIYQDLITDTFSTICSGIFLIVFGFCFVLIAIFMMHFTTGFNQLFFMGIFSFCIGLWSICNKGDIQLISNNYVLNEYLEYLSLYLCPISVLLFLRGIRGSAKRQKLVINLLLICHILMLTLTMVLHLLDIVHFASMLTSFHVLDAITIVYIFISSIRLARTGETQEKILILGVALLAFCFAYDLLIFNIAKYLNGLLSSLMGLSSWGGMVFVICMLFSYGVYVYRGICSRIEREALLELAYSDELTKLSNRARFMEDLNKFEQNKSTYTIISFDLNYLKQTNDIQGHAKGDLLLRCFSDVLYQSFHNFGLVSRMGGDEFSVLIPGDDVELTQKLMTSYEQNLAAKNSDSLPFEINAAYGIAYRSESANTSSTATLNFADKRMYQKKKAMKQQEKLR